MFAGDCGERREIVEKSYYLIQGEYMNNKLIYTGNDFEDIIYELLNIFNFDSIEREPKLEGRYRPDFLVQESDTKYIIEVKYYRTNSLQPSLIDNAIYYLKQYKDYKKVLIISSFINFQDRHLLNVKYPDIEIIDGYDLLYASLNNIDILEKLKGAISIDSYDESYFDYYKNFNNRNNFINKAKVRNNKSIKENEVKSSEEATRLISELENINAGKKGFIKYEDICVKILNYLFYSAIGAKQYQFESDDKLSRFDLVVRINPITEFWKFIVNEINSRYVIFEFKNYKDKIGQREILTTERYLLNLALRKVAIILTRKGYNESAHKFIRGALRETGKVIIVLNDEDLKEMLKMKMSGSDPTNLLFDKFDELFMNISRWLKLPV